MVVMSPQMERALTRPWSAATAAAALFVAIQGIGGAVMMLVFWIPPGEEFGDGSLRWEILRSEWAIYLAYAVVGLAATIVLRLVAQWGAAFSWSSLLLRAAVVYIPVDVVLSLLISTGWALAHGTSVHVLGFTLL